MRLAVLAVASFASLLAPGFGRPVAAQTGTCPLPAFAAPTVAGSAGTAPFDIAAGDFNADGLMDIATGGDDGAAVLAGDGTGRFGAATLFPRGFDVAIADFNGDGDADLAVAWTDDDNGALTAGIDVRIGNGAGGFGAALTLPAGEVVSDLAAADYDGNGTIDLAVTESRASQVLLFAGDGTGAFASPAILQFNSTTSGLAWGDVDADSDLDLAVTTFNESPPFDGAVVVLLGDGTGGFTALPGILSPIAPREIVLADFSSDGMLDFATINALPEPGTTTLAIHLGAGNGTFVLDHETEVLGRPTGLDAADFTGDGTRDVLIRDGDGVTTLVQIFVKGADPGSWPGRAFRIPTSAPGGVTAADLDGDGRPDVLATGASTGGNVLTLLNTCGQMSDLALGVTVPPEPVIAGREVTFTFTVQNLGPEPAAAQFILSIGSVGAGADFLSAVPSAGQCVSLLPAEEPFGGDAVVCGLGIVAPGEEVTIPVRLATHPFLTDVRVGAFVRGSVFDPNRFNNALEPSITTEVLGGRNLRISAGPLGGAQLLWDAGTAQAGYFVGRLVDGVTTVFPADGLPLPAGATTFIDPTATPGRTYCYVVTPIDAAGAPLGRSDMVCLVPGTASGQFPQGARIRVFKTGVRVEWTPLAAATGYVIWQQFLDTGETSTIPIPGGLSGWFVDGINRAACFAVLAYSGSTLLGHTNVMCAVPGFSTLPPEP